MGLCLWTYDSLHPNVGFTMKRTRIWYIRLQTPSPDSIWTKTYHHPPDSIPAPLLPTLPPTTAPRLFYLLPHRPFRSPTRRVVLRRGCTLEMALSARATLRSLLGRCASTSRPL